MWPFAATYQITSAPSYRQPALLLHAAQDCKRRRAGRALPARCTPPSALQVLLCCYGSCCCLIQWDSDVRVQATGLARCCLAPPAVRQGAADAPAGSRGAVAAASGDSDEEQWARADAPAANALHGLGSGRPLAAPIGDRVSLPGVCAPRAVGAPAPWPTPPGRGAAHGPGASAPRSGAPEALTPPQRDAAGLGTCSAPPTVLTTPPDGKEETAACSVVAAVWTFEHSGSAGAGANDAAQASVASPPVASAGAGASAPAKAESSAAEHAPPAASTAGRETHSRNARAPSETAGLIRSLSPSVLLPAAPMTPAEEATGATAHPLMEEGQAGAAGGAAGRTAPVQLMSLAG